mmetsp:Transcript_2525/g.5501  ORF Transcript_2525/g.5501 Transcript_2525/m.5501 type:complete len:179 (+) Transcript_2525:123-659(+)|eukprot:CAMPEP_0113507140 /NCGR_PEP_ID=MMETSP0014_2-20120614/36294_1 /TAXON_ID=2857 /ORGANISM="Nitzschia sp." /LENGTH=178 /DNA_ID=CAMNT_0000402705 /DNA_START=102 /DNA_END=638 /DNA_ORIENTATION=+ /assembly_acc=CAM_ASM_000159
MEILRDPCSPPSLLSNAEVLEVLQRQNEHNNGKELLQDSSKNSNDSNRDDISKNKHKGKKQKVYYKRRDWIQQETLMYLKTSPCSSLDVQRIDDLKAKFCTNDSNITHMTSSALSKKKNGDKGYSLTEAETIQVMNMMPQGSVVDVHLLVAEAHTRIGDESEVEKFLDTLNKYRKPTT